MLHLDHLRSHAVGEFPRRAQEVEGSPGVPMLWYLADFGGTYILSVHEEAFSRFTLVSKIVEHDILGNRLSATIWRRA